MAIIESDNSAIAKKLSELDALVEEGGGATYSGLVVESYDGGLRVRTKDSMDPGREIIRLSRDVLLPSNRYEISVKNDEFHLNFPDDSNITVLQKKLIGCLVDIYNLTDKARLHKKFSFLLSVVPHTEVLNVLMQGRKFAEKHQNWIADIQGDLDQAGMDNFVAQNFLQTRHLGYKDEKRMSNASILMPIVDFLNHNWMGSAFSVGGGTREGDLTVMNRQPDEGSNECYAFYGPMDAFDALIRYDFVDAMAPVVRSIPVNLKTPDGGEVQINANTGAMNNKKLVKKIADLRRYLPIMSLFQAEKILRASHIFIPIEGSPHSMRRILGLFLGNMSQDNLELEQSKVNDWVREAEHIIVTTNQNYYTDLLAAVERCAKGAGDDDFGLQSVKALATNQLDKLSRYEFMAEKS